MTYISVSQYFVTASGMFFFPLLIQRSPFDRRQNPLGLYHPHPLFPAVSQKRQHGFSQQVPLLFLLVVSRWAALRSRHVRAVFLALLMAVVTLAWLSVVLTDWWTMAALTGTISGRPLGEVCESREGENKKLQHPIQLRTYLGSFIFTALDSRVKAWDNRCTSFSF